MTVQISEKTLGPYESKPPAVPRATVREPGSRTAAGLPFVRGIRLGYGKMTDELRAPSDHLESLLFCGQQY